MSNELTTTGPDAAMIEKVIVGGDLSKMAPAERVGYYKAVCESVGLNPLTQPFDYLVLNGKMRLYALKSCTDQLRKIHHVSVSSIEAKETSGLYVVTCQVRDREGRTDASTGAVHIGNLKGEGLANAIMKAETKAKRRATLSICGLSLLDETEVETIPNAHVAVKVDHEIPRQDDPQTDSKAASIIERNYQKIRNAPDIETLKKMQAHFADNKPSAAAAARYELAFRDRLLELEPQPMEREPGIDPPEEDDDIPI